MINKKLWAITALAFTINFAPLTVNATAFPVYKSGVNPVADLGDAPTTCTPLGTMQMLAGTGIVANYPTIYHDPSCPMAPTGPIHHFPNRRAWLGNAVTGEYDAHRVPDIDGISNINISANVSDQDRADDGIFHPLAQSVLKLPECGSTTLKFVVSRTAGAAQTYRFNAWFDWNRDGDWADTAVKCNLPGGGTQNTPERAVANMAVALPACTSPVCTSVFTTSAFKTANSISNPYAKRMWMRASLTNITVAAANSDGSGPDVGYDFGETEDYLLKAISFNGGIWEYVP